MKRVAAACVCFVLLSGCAAAVVGTAAGVAAGIVYVKGALKDVLPVALSRADAAVRAASAELDLTGLDGGVESLEAHYRAHMTDGTRVWITLKAIDLQATAILIRVGAVGDRAIAQQILRHVGSKLEQE